MSPVEPVEELKGKLGSSKALLILLPDNNRQAQGAATVWQMVIYGPIGQQIQQVQHPLISLSNICISKLCRLTTNYFQGHRISIRILQ